MFKKANFENSEKIKEPDDNDKRTRKAELAPESDHVTGVVPTKEEFEKERREKLDDPSRRRDFR